MNIGNTTWEFVDTYDPGTYYETVILDRSTTATGAQRRKLEYYHTRKIKNHEKFLGEKSAAQELITGEINSYLITSLFENIIGYREHYPIKIIKLFRDSVCLKF